MRRLALAPFVLRSRPRDLLVLGEFWSVDTSPAVFLVEQDSLYILVPAVGRVQVRQIQDGDAASILHSFQLWVPGRHLWKQCWKFSFDRQVKAFPEKAEAFWLE